MFEVGEIEEEVFFDATEHLEVTEASDYDIWLREPQSVGERRQDFLSKMGFQSSEMIERRNSNSQASCSDDHCSKTDWSELFDDMCIEAQRKSNETKVVDVLEEDSSTTISKKKNQVIRWLKDKSKLGRMRSRRRDSKSNQQRWCIEQQVKAHNGLIWTMRLSPDGQYLASGGEDGVVIIRRVYVQNKSTHASVKTFHLGEEAVQEFKGHSSDVLDLAWSTSNHLLSTSMDKTVRLWHVDSNKCLGVFHHTNYVTCVQFNPVDEHYFISGSIDGIVRVWSINSGRVVEWANVRDDIVTAVCYQPNGKGFVVGTLSGNCRFYESSGDDLLLNAEIYIGGKKKSSANKITGIQFLKNHSGRLMITSEDSKIRILDGLEVVLKYKGLTKSGSQTSASLTWSGRHIVSLGEEDSRVYIWNYDDMWMGTTPKSRHCCESFISQGTSVVLPLLDLNVDAFSRPTRKANRFSMDRATWPEEKLPCDDGWGLVFVAANYDGTITTLRESNIK